MKKQKEESEPDSEDDIDNQDAIERKESDTAEKLELVSSDQEPGNSKKPHPFSYKKLGRHFLATEAKKESYDAHVTAATYHKKTRILVIAFSTGSFFLYELPDVNMIHSLSIAGHAITTAAFNATGDWIALGAAGIGHLLVWEWQSICSLCLVVVQFYSLSPFPRRAVHHEATRTLQRNELHIVLAGRSVHCNRRRGC